MEGPATFKPSGEYDSVVVCSSQKLSGLSQFQCVRPSMREKIDCNEFVESGKILHEADYVGHNDAEDIEAGVSMDPDSQATLGDPKTRIELMEKLLLFSCYYLQKFQDNTISFLDYPLFLIHWSRHLNVPSLVQLDREMR